MNCEEKYELLRSAAQDLCSRWEFDPETGNVIVEAGYFNRLCELVDKELAG